MRYRALETHAGRNRSPVNQIGVYRTGRCGLSLPWSAGWRGCNLALSTGKVTPFSRRTIKCLLASGESANTRTPVTVPYPYGDSANAIDLFRMRSVHRSASQLTAFGRDLQNYYAPRAAIGQRQSCCRLARYIQPVRQGPDLHAGVKRNNWLSERRSVHDGSS